jgi:hypothetical protein
MMAAMPQYRPYAGGMDGGSDNPLGARALYLYRNGRDTYFRLHGTNEPESIGHAVSSGCIRLLNEDIIDLGLAGHARGGSAGLVRAPVLVDFLTAAPEPTLRHTPLLLACRA